MDSSFCLAAFCLVQPQVMQAIRIKKRRAWGIFERIHVSFIVKIKIGYSDLDILFLATGVPLLFAESTLLDGRQP